MHMPRIRLIRLGFLGVSCAVKSPVTVRGNCVPRVKARLTSIHLEGYRRNERRRWEQR